MEDIVSELEAKKLTNATLQADIAKQIKQKEAELATKKQEISTKITELDKQVIEIVKNQREQLKSYKISEGFTGDKKRTESELFQIEQLLLTLRYLENEGEVSLPSSSSEENTALVAIENIF